MWRVGALLAAVLAALAAAAVYIYRKKLSIWSTLDALTPLVAVMGIAIGISHFASGNAFGKATSLPIGIQLWGEVRHPTQIYEIFFSILILVLTYFIDRTSWSRIPGNLFLAFVSLTSISRLTIEAFRGDKEIS